MERGLHEADEEGDIIRLGDLCDGRCEVELPVIGIWAHEVLSQLEVMRSGSSYL